MILAIETSSPHHSLCLARLDSPEDVLATANWPGGARAGRLLVELDAIRQYLPGVRLIAVGTGPGSFSGIRAAISAAKGLRTVLGCPLVGTCSADAVAKDLARVSRLGVFADAKRNELYLTEFALGRRIRGPFTIPTQSLDDCLAKLTLAVSAEPLPGIPERAWPVAATLAQVAAESWRINPAANHDPEPIYLRGPTPRDG